MKITRQALANILHTALDGEILSDIYVETLSGENELTIWTGENEDVQTFVLTIEEEN